MTLKITRPAFFTVAGAAAILTASNVAETDYAAWSVGTAYAVGARVIVAADHAIYEAAAAVTGGLSPAAAIAAGTSSAPSKWFLVSATNKFKMFDAAADTQTSNATEIDVTFTAPGRSDVLFLAGLDAQTVIVVGTVGATEFFNETFDLTRTDNVHNFEDYVFEPIIRKTALRVPMPKQLGTVSVRVRIQRTGTPAKCGTLIFGASRTIGEVQSKPKVSIVSYSRVIPDEFGITKLIKRANVLGLAYDLFVENNYFDEAVRLMQEYIDVPLLYSGSDEFESLNTFAIVKNFGGVLSSDGGTFCNLEILGLSNVN